MYSNLPYNNACPHVPYLSGGLNKLYPPTNNSLLGAGWLALVDGGDLTAAAQWRGIGDNCKSSAARLLLLYQRIVPPILHTLPQPLTHSPSTGDSIDVDVDVSAPRVVVL